MKEKIGLLGSGGQADEAESFLPENSIEFRALDREYLDALYENQIEVLNPTDYQRMIGVVAAIGAPAIRRSMIEKWPGDSYAIIISEEAYVDRSSIVGEGSIIAPRVVVTTNVEIGKHSIINVAASISHDCKLGDYVTVSPGARIAGKVKLGDGVFVGIGAIINHNLRIAAGSVIGAGAVVINNVDTENSVLVGSPARVIKYNEGWISEV